jgi:hypothetical protein
MTFTSKQAFSYSARAKQRWGHESRMRNSGKPELTKSELQNLLKQAVKNTGVSDELNGTSSGPLPHSAGRSGRL